MCDTCKELEAKIERLHQLAPHAEESDLKKLVQLIATFEAEISALHAAP